jgi:hypothetical protein
VALDFFVALDDQDERETPRLSRGAELDGLRHRGLLYHVGLQSATE